jgi:hypothetical protein
MKTASLAGNPPYSFPPYSSLAVHVLSVLVGSGRRRGGEDKARGCSVAGSSIFSCLIQRHRGYDVEDGRDTGGKAAFTPPQDLDERQALNACVERSEGANCVIAKIAEYGCVGNILDHQSGTRVAGKGPDDGAKTEAYASLLPGLRCPPPQPPPAGRRQ